MTTNSDVAATGRQYGSFSGHGGYHDDCEGIDIGLLLTALLGIGVGFFTLFTKITMITGRRKKRDIDDTVDQIDPIRAILDELHDVVYGGMLFFDSVLVYILHQNRLSVFLLTLSVTVQRLKQRDRLVYKQRKTTTTD